MNPIEQSVRALLRENLLNLALAIIISFAGFAALALARTRTRGKEPILIWFGLFAAIYGIRQLAKNALIPLTIAGPDLFWQRIVTSLDYVIVIPAMLFFEQLYGPGWRNSVRWAIWILAAYASAGIVLSIGTGAVQPLPDPGRVLSLPVAILVLVLGWMNGYRSPRFPDIHVPLAGGAIFVLSVLVEHYAPERFHFEPLGFFAFLLSLAIVAVRRVIRDQHRLFAVEEEMASARRIQASILPSREPQVGGITIAARYSPMASVAGDFYDFVLIDASRVGILVADVAGHGVPAALIASMVKIAFASQQEHASDPARVITGLNNVFCKQLTGQYITAGYLVVNPIERTGLYAGAAHPPLIVFRKSGGAVERFENNGLLLGFRPNNSYSNVTVPLAAGDRILLYTDGMTEAENPAGESFEGQVDARIVSHAALSTAHFADALVNDLEAWSAPGSKYNPADDLTLIVVDVG